MTAASFADDMAGGGGKYAAVFFIAGMPWAVTTSTELVAALSDPNHGGTDAQKNAWAYRAMMFGQRNLPGINAYPSDHVQIIPSLDADLGKQSISYDESKGLSGGGWTVKFGRGAHAATYTHFRSGAVAGTYDGLDVMPDPMYDASVKTGILAGDWDGTGAGATLSWENDTGLYDLIKTNNTAGNPTYIWMQNSCLGVEDASNATAPIYTATAYSGCLRTVREPIYLNQANSGATMMASAPATSIVGMPAVLWLVPMTDAGAIVGLPVAPTDLTDLDEYTKPVMFRAGPVKPNPTCDTKTWKVDCGSWLDYMNVDVPIEEFSGELQGYMLSRTTAALSEVVQRAHLEIYEWNGLAYVTTHIWLCAAEGEVYAEDKEALIDLLNTALSTRAPNSDAEVNEFHVSMGHLEVGAPGDVNGHPTFVNGPLAWILALGYANTGLYHYGAMNTPVFETYFNTAVPSDTSWTGHSDDTGWLYVWDPSNGDATWWGKKIIGKMRYYYQWAWNSEYFTNLGWDTFAGEPEDFEDRKIGFWPISEYATNNDYRFVIKPEFDATTLTAGENVTLGTLGHFHRLTGEVESVGDNYVEITNDNAAAGVSRMKVELWSPLHKMLWGQPIFYWPHLHDDHWFAFFDPGDQFRVTQAFEMESDSLTEMFLGLLGNSTDGMSLPRRSRVHHAPDVWNDTADMRELIDWDRLEQLAPPAIPGTVFRLQLGSAGNIAKLFFNVLLNLGIRQTWGYNESKRAWVMSFEPLGDVNAAKALSMGRVLASDNLISAESKSIYGNTWLYHTINAKLNYSGSDPGVNLSMPNATGRAMMSSGNKTLKIDDKVLQVEPSMEEDYALSLRGMLHYFNAAQPSVSAKGAAAAIPLAVVGGDCLLTSQLVFDLFEGAYGVTRRAALMTGVTTIINKSKIALDLSLRLAPAAKAIGPSLRLEAANMSKTGAVITVTGLATDPANNVFQNPLNSPNGLTDLAYFGCIDYNPATDTRKLRDCSCTKYPVVIVEENTTTWDIAGAGRNMFTGYLRGHTTDTLVLDDVSNGRCRIDIDADEAEFNAVTGIYIVYFCDWDHASIQPCQQVYGWLGDEDGMIANNDGDKSRCISWSG